MATLREIKRRVKTAKNIGQVTRAMEMVSAVKMKKAQAAALSGRPYSAELERMLRVLASTKNMDSDRSYFSLPEKVSKVAVLVVAPKKGLSGPLLTNLLRTLGKFLEAAKIKSDISSLLFCPDAELFCPLINTSGLETNFLSVGPKARDMARKLGQNLLAEFPTIDRQPTLGTIRPIADYLVKLYQSGQADLVLVAYTHFENTVSQKAVIRQFLPILPVKPFDSAQGKEEKKENSLEPTILFEPTPEAVLEALLLRYSEAVLYQIVLESLAAEHSARMVAMKNAHDNASEIIEDLTLFYNKARQNAITSELADTVSASLSVS